MNITKQKHNFTDLKETSQSKNTCHKFNLVSNHRSTYNPRHLNILWTLRKEFFKKNFNRTSKTSDNRL